MLMRPFGAEVRAFIIRGRGWRELEKARDCGLGVLAARLAPLVASIEVDPKTYPGGFAGMVANGLMGQARLDDVREPILQALIDGGLTSTVAGALVRNVFDEETEKGRGPLLQFAPLAYDLVMGAIIGLDDEQPEVDTGEPKGAEATNGRRSRTAKPASSTSTSPSP